MPLFEYKCPNGHTFDKLVRYGAPREQIECIECRKVAPSRALKHSVPADLQVAAPRPFVWGRGGGW